MSETTEACGPHCGVKDRITGHCKGCHRRDCEASHYDRDEVKRVD